MVFTAFSAHFAWHDMLFLVPPILETTKESGTKNANEESESETKEIFEKENCKTEANGTKAREEVRRLKSTSRSVGCFVR